MSISAGLTQTHAHGAALVATVVVIVHEAIHHVVVAIHVREAVQAVATGVALVVISTIIDGSSITIEVAYEMLILLYLTPQIWRFTILQSSQSIDLKRFFLLCTHAKFSVSSEISRKSVQSRFPKSRFPQQSKPLEQ